MCIWQIGIGLNVNCFQDFFYKHKKEFKAMLCYQYRNCLTMALQCSTGSRMKRIHSTNVYNLSEAAGRVPSVLGLCGTSHAFTSLLPAAGAWRRPQSCPRPCGGWRCGTGVIPRERPRRWEGRRAEARVSRCTALGPDSLSAAGRRSG